MEETLLSENEVLLESLSVEPGTIAFKPEQYEYHVTVDEDVTKLLISAQTAENVTYTVGGNTGLKPGENTVTVTVTDEAGDSVYYKIYVQVGEKKESTSEAAAENEKPVKENAADESLPDTPVQTYEGAQTTQPVPGGSAGPQKGEEAQFFSGSRRTVAYAVIACVLAAAVCWAIFVIRRHLVKKAREEEKRQRQIRREKERERQRLALQQEEELLRQIELLTEKSKKAGQNDDNGKLRIIELDQEELNRIRNDRGANDRKDPDRYDDFDDDWDDEESTELDDLDAFDYLDDEEDNDEDGNDDEAEADDEAETDAGSLKNLQKGGTGSLHIHDGISDDDDDPSDEDI